MSPKPSPTAVPEGAATIELTRESVLPWEELGEYRALVADLVDEYEPEGRVEEYLVEEVAGILWRKRRFSIAEASSCQRGLLEAARKYGGTVKAALIETDNDELEEDEDQRHPTWVSNAIHVSQADTVEVLERFVENETTVRRALEIVNAKGVDAYDQALAHLTTDVRSGWEEDLKANPVKAPTEPEARTLTTSRLRKFLEKEVLPWCLINRKELENRAAIRRQAYGEALSRLGEQQAREEYLDKKLERTLALLERLQEKRLACGW